MGGVRANENMKDKQNMKDKKTYMIELYELYRPIKSGDIVLDIGACVGDVTVFAANSVGDSGHVYAFEPHPDNFDRLLTQAGHLKNVTCLPCAMASPSGPIDFWPHQHRIDGHSLFKHDLHLSTPIRVMCISMQDFLTKYAVIPTFVKIDAEGSELHILKELMLTPHRPYITLEVHPQFIGPIYDDCRQVLETNGYAWVDPLGYQKNKQAVHHAIHKSKIE